MLGRLRKAQDEREGGFTLIELLVVIIIIGILAAIAIPVFLRQREKGWKSAMKADLKNAATAVESYGTDNNGDYTGMDGAATGDALLGDEGFKGTQDVTVTVNAPAADAYCIDAVHSRIGDLFSYSSDVGAPVAGAC